MEGFSLVGCWCGFEFGTEDGGREDVGSHGNGSRGGGRCNEREDGMELKVGNGKRGMVNGITSDQRTYLEEFTSAPCSINNFTTKSFPPNDTACNGKTPSRTELIGCLREGVFDETHVPVRYGRVET